MPAAFNVWRANTGIAMRKLHALLTRAFLAWAGFSRLMTRWAQFLAERLSKSVERAHISPIELWRLCGDTSGFSISRSFAAVLLRQVRP